MIHGLDNLLKKAPRPKVEVSAWCQGSLYRKSYGYDGSNPADVFEIGSIGKTFTAMLLAILNRKGIVGLHDPLAKFKPELTCLKNTTLSQLASHTSGLPSNPFKGLLLTSSNFQNRINKFQQSDLEAYLGDIKKPLTSGKFKYSNSGAALLGQILAECTGSTYEQAVKELILSPLGMDDTHIHCDAYQQQRVAVGHDGRGRPVPPFYWQGMEAAGVWRSTTDDMMKFLKALLGHSGKYWRELALSMTEPIAKFSKAHDIGLGWLLARQKTSAPIAWHNGGTLGQHAVAAWCTDQDKAIVAVTNQRPPLWHNFVKSYHLEHLVISFLEDEYMCAQE